MQATVSLDEPGNLLVTVKAKAGHLLLAATSPSGVTLRALQRTIETGMRACQGSRRDLGAEECGSTEADERHHDDASHPRAAQSAGSRIAT